MEYVNFGSAGVQVSRLALGLGFRGQSDEADAQRVIEAAIDSGINLIDCANVYGLMDDRANIGRSEVVLGKALKGKRDDVIITSKVASEIGPGPNDIGLSRYHILREVERSLRRLDTDHLDVYLVHRYDETTPLGETLSALDSLVRDGKIRYFGVCNFTAWQVCKALWSSDRNGQESLICVQNPYSLMNRSLETEMFGMVADQGIGIMAYSPLAVGLLSGHYSADAPAPDGSLWATSRKAVFETALDGKRGQTLTAVQEVARESGKTPAQVALAWVLSHPEISVAITGGDTLAHLEDNLGAVGWKLDDEQIARLNEASASLSTVLD